MANLTAILSALAMITVVSGQTQQVVLCPLYLAIQNRCPTPSTTTASATTSTARTTTEVGNGNDSNDTTNSSESDVVTDACGLPTITFCPATEVFLNGGRRCTAGQTVQISLTTLGQLLINPSQENAEATAGSGNGDELGNALASVSKTIQAPPTQAAATVGVTFIPVGQLIGG